MSKAYSLAPIPDQDGLRFKRDRLVGGDEIVIVSNGKRGVRLIISTLPFVKTKTIYCGGLFPPKYETIRFIDEDALNAEIKQRIDMHRKALSSHDPLREAQGDEEAVEFNSQCPRGT